MVRFLGARPRRRTYFFFLEILRINNKRTCFPATVVRIFFETSLDEKPKSILNPLISQDVDEERAVVLRRVVFEKPDGAREMLSTRKTGGVFSVFSYGKMCNAYALLRTCTQESVRPQSKRAVGIRIARRVHRDRTSSAAAGYDPTHLDFVVEKPVGRPMTVAVDGAGRGGGGGGRRTAAPAASGRRVAFVLVRVVRVVRVAARSVTLKANA